MPAYPTRKASKRPPGKKPPLKDDDAEVLDDPPPAEEEEAPAEEPAEEGAEGEGEEGEAPSERLQMPRKSVVVNGLEDQPDRVSFVPLRTTKGPGQGRSRKLVNDGRAGGISGKIQLPGSVASGVPK